LAGTTYKDVVCGRTTRYLPQWCLCPDGFQPAEVERGQDGTYMGWVEVQCWSLGR